MDNTLSSLFKKIPFGVFGGGILKYKTLKVEDCPCLNLLKFSNGDKHLVGWPLVFSFLKNLRLKMLLPNKI